MSKQKFVLVGIGEVLWDEFPTGRRIGGAPANFAYHCRVLGANAHIVSAVGDDDAGEEIIEHLARKGLDTAYIEVDPDHPTGSVLVSLSDNGIPKYVIREPVAWDFISGNSDQIEVARRADAICFGTLAQRSHCSRNTIRAFLEAAKPHCIKIFDVNLRQKYFSPEILREGLRLANVLKLNEDELHVIAGVLGLNGTTDSIMGELKTRYTLDVLALTMGERGCIIRSGNLIVQNTAEFTDTIIDTVGAGDCFSAVLAMGLLRGEPLESIAERANRRAAFVCTQAGAMPEMPKPSSQ